MSEQKAKPLPTLERLSGMIKFRVDPAQERTVREQAASAGLSISDFARQVMLDANIAPRRRPKATGTDERSFALALAALNKIGTNLNQIARISNAQKHVSFDEFRLLKALQAELKEARTALLQAFGEEP